jgi:hypothetical protein
MSDYICGKRGPTEGILKPIPADKQFTEGEFLRIQFRNCRSEDVNIRRKTFEVAGIVDYVTKHVVGLRTYGGRLHTFTNTDLFTRDVIVLERG